MTSTNVLVASSDPAWSVISGERENVILDGMPLGVRTAELLRTDTTDQRLVVWQWYWIDGKLTASDIEAKLLTAIARLRGRGDDSAVIILYAHKESATDCLPAFAMQAIGSINQMLDATRETR